ncbi:MAG TPA: CHAT domain-containing tetratricopeptide repeat protein [Planctomycetota bacterium]|nr:CHAT domain-containing tetratricopeptide repeat protein [Planctomycetota bacterium]
MRTIAGWLLLVFAHVLPAQHGDPRGDAELADGIARARASVGSGDLAGARAAVRALWQQVAPAMATRSLDELSQLSGVAADARDLRLALTILQRMEPRLSQANDASPLALHRLHLRMADLELELGHAQQATDEAESVLAELTNLLPADDVLLQGARVLLSNCYGTLGRTKEARQLAEQALAVLETHTGVDERGLCMVRGNVAALRFRDGDLRGAIELERQVIATMERVLTAGDFELLRARSNLAAMLDQAGDRAGASQLARETAAAKARMLPADDPELQLSYLGVAERSLGDGDKEEALAITRGVIAALEPVYPPTHANLLRAKTALVHILSEMGDLDEALVTAREIVQRYEESAPADDPELLESRLAMAGILFQRGEVSDALSLQSACIEVMEAKLPGDHPLLQRARCDLAQSLKAEGEADKALGLETAAIAVMERTLPPDSRDLLRARGNLTATRRLLGQRDGEVAADASPAATAAPKAFDMQAAEREHGALVTKGDREAAAARDVATLQALRERFPISHPWIQDLTFRLGLNTIVRGDPSASHVAEDYLRSWLTSLEGEYPAAALRARVEQNHVAVGMPLSLALGCGTLDPMPEMAAVGLLLTETFRGAHLISSRWHRRLQRATGSAEALQLLARWRETAAEVARTANAAATPAGARLLAEVVRRRNDIERQLHDRLAGGTASVRDWSALTVHDLARCLPPTGAAVSFVRTHHMRFGSQAGSTHGGTQPLVAIVLRPDGHATAISLAAADEVSTLVATVRSAMIRGASRSGSPAPGRDPGRSPDEEKSADAMATLREKLLDPVLASTGPVSELYVSVDESLSMLPIDALPTKSGEPLGAAVRVHVLPTLLMLLPEPTRPHAAVPRLVAFGDCDYGKASAPARDDDAGLPFFPPLPASARELERVAASFHEAHPTAPCDVVTGPAATKQALFASAPAATYLLVSTHAYTVDPEATTASRAGEASQRQLSPMVLTGLALAGANEPAGAFGTRTGVATAEELAVLDLSDCRLAVLSACSTATGAQLPGQGLGSLARALHAAGAGAVLCSLWPVQDASAGELMASFFHSFLVDGLDPADALWHAKMQARARPGSSIADWGGWVLIGG